jgi:hypothetical protein
MFAHQVINDLSVIKKEYPKITADYLFMLNAEFWQDKIRNSIKFDLGEMSNIFENFNRDKSVNTLLIKSEWDQAKMPFDCCWFEYIYSQNELPSDIDLTVKSNKDLIAPKQIAILAYIDFGALHLVSFIKSPTVKMWAPGSFTFALNFENKKFDHTWLVFNEILHLQPCFSSININNDKMAGRETVQIKLLYNILTLLNTKNIGMSNMDPPLNIKLKSKKLKLPIFTYKILVVKNLGTNSKTKTKAKNLWNNRVHLCRGHFKTYTTDNPLFGKYIGRYWWQPSVRGQNKKGVVIKDYKIETDGK